MPIAEMNDGGRTLTRGEIDALAKRLGTLPEEYVAFLLTHNGGRPTPDLLQGIDPKDEGIVDFFFQVGGSMYTDLEHQVEKYRESDAQRDLLPIARTPSGDLICLGTGGGDRAKVFFWSDDELVRSQRGWRLAEDLPSFIESLHEELTSGDP